MERCCFLTFSFERNLRKYDISLKRKHTKLLKKDLFCPFHKSSLDGNSFYHPVLIASSYLVSLVCGVISEVFVGMVFSKATSFSVLSDPGGVTTTIPVKTWLG